MNVLDLFSGIGGFSLGLERAGMRTVAFCEIDPYCQAVLRKHWPDVPVFGDVCALTAEALADAKGRAGEFQSSKRQDLRDEPAINGAAGIDVICGGFPCQDISVAGKGAGIEGSRSGLWKEYVRIIGEVRPRYVIVENVAALLGRGLERVLGDLAALGYDAEWHCIPASAVGAPHRRDRIWIVAYSRRDGCQSERERPERSGSSRENQGDQDQRQRIRASATDGGEDVADAEREGLQGFTRAGEPRTWWASSLAASINEGCGGQWLVEPDVGRVAHGIPGRVDRLRGLGNAVVPQVAEHIGRMIMEAA